MPHYLLQFFNYQHLPANLQPVSIHFHAIAHQMDKDLPNNSEKSTAMRKLLEAKDCAVRAVICNQPEPKLAYTDDEGPAYV